MTCKECNECPECEEKEPCNNCEECNECNECEKEEPKCCLPHIVWECIDVTYWDDDTITISTECNPEVISTDWTINITVKDSEKPNRSLAYDLSVVDKKVAVCEWDTHPGTLSEKIVGKDWITVTSSACPGNGVLEIGFDSSSIQCEDPKVAVASWCTKDYLWNLIVADPQSNLTVEQRNCKVVLGTTESTEPYIKVYLKETYIDSIPKWSVAWYGFISWQGWAGMKLVQLSMDTDYEIGSRTTWQPWLKYENWSIVCEKRGLYNVWFSGSLECGYGIHWVRVQMYVLHKATWEFWTVVESRYSAPVWNQPYEASGIWTTTLSFKDNTYNPNTWARFDLDKSVSLRIDSPIITEKTDASWVRGKSASLWAYVSRMPVGWTTIVALEVWDKICLWAKIQTEIDYDWDILGKYKVWWWEFALLWRKNWGNAWDECWLSFYAHYACPIAKVRK